MGEPSYEAGPSDVALLDDAARVRVQRDRAAAITDAIAGCGEGDIVLVAGKGHEPYQEVRGVRHDFDDTLVARAALGGAAMQDDAGGRA